MAELVPKTLYSIMCWEFKADQPGAAPEPKAAPEPRVEPEMEILPTVMAILESAPAKKHRGRPSGSKNKPKLPLDIKTEELETSAPPEDEIKAIILPILQSEPEKKRKGRPLGSKNKPKLPRLNIQLGADYKVESHEVTPSEIKELKFPVESESATPK